MTIGVYQNEQIIVRLTLTNDGGDEEQVDAVVDTGFGGSLMLTQAVVQGLALPQLDVADAILADGSTVRLPVYGVNVFWNEEERTVLAYAGAGDTLLGMSLLRGCLGSFEFFDGGTALIETI